MPQQSHSKAFLLSQLTQLERLRAELSTRVARTTVEVGVGDLGDLAAAAAETESTFSGVERTRDTLHDVADAIARIRGGTYGVCEVSGELIPEARLAALPFARCSVKAQAGRERFHSESRKAHRMQAVRTQLEVEA